MDKTAAQVKPKTMETYLADLADMKAKLEKLPEKSELDEELATFIAINIKWLSDVGRQRDESTKDRNRLQIELSEAHKKINILESRLNQSISDRKRAEDEVKEVKEDIDGMEKQLATTRKQLQENVVDIESTDEY